VPITARFPSRLSRWRPAAAAAAGVPWLLVAAPATAVDEPPLAPLKPIMALQPPPRADGRASLPIVLRARELQARPDLGARAVGDVEFRQAGTVIRAETLEYSQVEDLVTARGDVRISRDGSVFSGPELQLRLQTFEGYFVQPRFEFLQLGAGGRAERFEFSDRSRGRAIAAQYTSCPRDGSADPDWLLTADRISFDVDANEGVAEGGTLRFLGVPILALPTLSFPITEERKSGWLPPSLNIDNRGGIELAVPYYWNVAPNRDATLTPKFATRRGIGLETELRYLERTFQGELGLDLLPHDRAADASRWQADIRHEGLLERARYEVRGVRVSDDDWWKDFPRATGTLTPRLLPLLASIERPLAFGTARALGYARVLRWQALQDVDAPITPPYHRSPQIGVQAAGQNLGLDWSFETEFNQFLLQDLVTAAALPTGLRLHALGAVAWPWRSPGWWVTPRVSFNAAAYDLDQALPNDGRTRLARTIPTASLDAGLEFERSTEAFGRRARQSLEPRLLFVRTPYRAQNPALAFDSALKDFNFSSIFSENAYAGIDRVSEAHQLTAGVTTRLVEEDSGAELLRLGLVQRYQFEPPTDAPPGQPQRNFSDLLMLGSANVVRGWIVDASVQYNADVNRVVRSIVSARYSPGPFRTIGGTYRLTRDSIDPLRGVESEQLAVGWQWPVGAFARSGSTCQGRLYSVGRLNYSVTDGRFTDSILGLEYDAGCWIGRFVAERLSTGRSEATTRLLLQLELVGLSRLGTNPLKVLKDNIPGYRLLREDSDESSPPTIYD
jgi:LPS-assembly protein